MGERIVKGLLATAPAVRLIYKPHPLTGSRSKEAKAVHERIVELIRAAGGDSDATSLDGTGAPGGHRPHARRCSTASTRPTC